ncbi:MAG: hypothetical protein KDI75_06450 [Xanthomonadales bacterium]|nr:hypothetical protein [Xanthomonadales bacterium]
MSDSHRRAMTLVSVLSILCSSALSIAAQAPVESVIQIASGDNHACALLAGGSVKCWGANDEGQLGDGGYQDAVGAVDVVGLRGPVQTIALGKHFSCALLVDGSVQCWGTNQLGQLGNDAAYASPFPVDVTDLQTGVQAISGGSTHACGLLDNGTLRCWGGNLENQLGAETPLPHGVTREVDGLGGPVEAVDLGDAHSCALLISGNVECWGSNAFGQLGVVASGAIATPAEVTSLGNTVQSISIDGAHGCALMDSGGVKCWGDNRLGQRGNGTTINSHDAVNVDGLSSGVESIGTGYAHSCAIGTDGGLLCWGANGSGQLGNTTTAQANVPVAVSGLVAEVGQVSGGRDFSCARLTGGEARCWGNNFTGQLGIDKKTFSTRAVDVFALGGEVRQISAGSGHTCARLVDGGLKCWGSNQFGQLGVLPIGRSVPIPTATPGLAGDVDFISAGGGYTCSLLNPGGVNCWGFNYQGQLGNRSTEDSVSPVAAVGLANDVQTVEAGDGAHSCALLDNGDVKCWGNNAQGQLGTGDFASSLTPVTVIGLPEPATQVALGRTHACALLQSGAVRCWGSNALRQLGVNEPETSPTPIQVQTLLSAAVKVVAHDYATCALLDTGKVQCWGTLPTSLAAMPSVVPGLTDDSVDITAGSSFACAVTTEAAVMCWGSNFWGQLGNGTRALSLHATEVLGLSDAAQSISAGVDHACAVLADGSVQCWGHNYGGQLGNGDRGIETTPLPVRLGERIFRSGLEP